jgi:hypothetical protein
MCHEESLEASSRLDFGSRGHEFSRNWVTLEGGALDEVLEQSVLLDPNSRLTKIREAQEEAVTMGPGVTRIVQLRKRSSRK